MSGIDATVAVDAINLVEGDRAASYGPVEENLQRVADMWAGYLQHPVSAEDVAAMMVLLKVARSRAGYTRDNTVDGVAYLLIQDYLARRE